MSLSPWSVKGVDPETRDAAKVAARRAGQTLGVWLKRAIHSAATDQLIQDRAPMADATPASVRGDMSGGLNRPQMPTAADLSAASPTIKLMFETMQKLVGRIEEIEDRLPDPETGFDDLLQSLDAEIKALRERSGESAGNVERSIARLSERISRMEAQTAPPSPDTNRKFGLGQGA